MRHSAVRCTCNTRPRFVVRALAPAYEIVLDVRYFIN